MLKAALRNGQRWSFSNARVQEQRFQDEPKLIRGHGKERAETAIRNWKRSKALQLKRYDSEE